ncbi:Crp/Fnr family transcriptional regulator [Sebaldella sp. S0638]|nr:Crp/Fnr family transcriptional regulator [Sebaldella sp. S0638]
MVFAEEENNFVYFLIEGLAEAYILAPQGLFSSIHLYKAGSFFGEIEQFYEGRKPVEITAITDCVVDILHKKDFLNWLRNDFEATKFLIAEISYKLVINAELVEEVLLLTVKERLLRCIASHQYRNNLDRLTKEQVTKEANAPMRSINRAIAECSDQGIISYKNKRFTILDEKKVNTHLPQYMKK